MYTLTSIHAVLALRLEALSRGKPLQSHIDHVTSLDIGGQQSQWNDADSHTQSAGEGSRLPLSFKVIQTKQCRGSRKAYSGMVNNRRREETAPFTQPVPEKNIWNTFSALTFRKFWRACKPAVDAVTESNQRLVAVMKHTWHFRMLPKISDWDNIMPATYESAVKWKWEDTTGKTQTHSFTLKRLHLKWLWYIKYYLRTHSLMQEGLWRNIAMENPEDQEQNECTRMQ